MDLEGIERRYVLNTYARSYVNFIRGVGAKLYDEAGNDYIDFASGIGVTSVGHAHPKLSQALCMQADTLLHVSNLFVIEPQVKLAKRLVELSGFEMGCFFANSGAEANEGAIKLARKYGEMRFDRKRYKVITLEHSFHGRTITTVKATGQEKMHQPHFSPYPDGFSYVKTLDEIASAIDEETVAVLIELVQGEGGVEPLDKEKVQATAQMLKERGVLLIVDEVQTGIYRTGELLASQVYGIKPDIVTLAKGLGGGVPIGVVMSSLTDVFAPGDHGSTFGGNYLSCTAGLTVLDILQERYASGKLFETISYFEASLETFMKAHTTKFVRAVGIGLMKGLRLKEGLDLSKVVQEALKERVVVLKAGRNTLRFLPSLTIAKEEIDEGFKRLERALARI